MNNILHQNLLNELQKAFPKKKEMVNLLSELLLIEKGAVYRRIREEVPFTFNEVAIISKHLKISLDEMIGNYTNKYTPFQSILTDFISPQKEDINKLESHLKYLQSINNSGNSEIVSVNNILPHELFSEFQSLSQFYLFIWNFHHDINKAKPFNQIFISDEIKRYLKDYSLEMKKFNKTGFIFDSRVFIFFVNKIKYFNSIRMIEDEDIKKIKDDLLSLLDYIEKLTLTGYFNETGNPVNLYISDLEIAANYACIESDLISMCLVKIFLLSSVGSIDDCTFAKMKKWIQSLIKISTLITVTNEKQRVLYFEKQRKIVDEL